MSIELFLRPANNSFRGAGRLGAGNGEGRQPACTSPCQPEGVQRNVRISQGGRGNHYQEPYRWSDDLSAICVND